MIIGIDFGTCYSAVSVMKGKIPTRGYVTDPNNTGTPTQMAFNPNTKTECFGYDCLSQFNVGSFDQVIHHFKRTVRENPDNLSKIVTSNGHNYSLEDVIKKYLSNLLLHVKEGVEKEGEIQNTEFEAVTITAPVGVEKDNMTASDYSRLLHRVLKDITGLPSDKINVLQEPVAAAMAYIHAEDQVLITKKQKLMVFDLGGGTLDVTIVEYDPQTYDYKVAQKDGDLYLGGIEWDHVLAGLCLSLVGLDESDLKRLKAEDPQAYSEFEQNVTKCKQTLSLQPKATLTIESDTLDLFETARITQKAFEDASMDLINRAMQVVNDSLTHYNNGKMSEIDKVILVGGSSNMPMIRDCLLTFFPDLTDDKVYLYEPSYAICKGAALYAMNMNQETGIRSIGNIHDTTGTSYGFYAVNSDTSTSMIYNLIFKGSEYGSNGTITASCPDWFTPLNDTQSIMYVKIYESVAEKPKNNDYWIKETDGKANGTQIMVTIPAAYRGAATKFRFKVTLVLNHNQILEIKLTDGDGKPIQGKQTSL